MTDSNNGHIIITFGMESRWNIKYCSFITITYCTLLILRHISRIKYSKNVESTKIKYKSQREIQILRYELVNYNNENNDYTRIH